MKREEKATKLRPPVGVLGDPIARDLYCLKACPEDGLQAGFKGGLEAIFIGLLLQRPHLRAAYDKSLLIFNKEYNKLQYIQDKVL